MNIEITDQ